MNQKAISSNNARSPLLHPLSGTLQQVGTIFSGMGRAMRRGGSSGKNSHSIRTAAATDASRGRPLLTWSDEHENKAISVESIANEKLITLLLACILLVKILKICMHSQVVYYCIILYTK